MTHKRSSLQLVAVLVVSVLVAGVAGAQEPDRLFLKGEQESIQGFVRKEAPQKLVWQKVDSQGNRLATREYDWEKVKRVKYGQIPDAFSEAKKLYQQGKNLAKAVQLLDSLMTSGDTRSIFVQKAAYLKAEILARKKDFKKAFQALDEATKRFPRYRKYPGAMKRKMNMAMKMGDKQLALETAQELEKSGSEKAEALAAFLKGKMAMQEGNYDEALDHFEDAENASDVAVRNKAMLGMGNVYMEKGDLDRARDRYESILRGSREGLTAMALAGAHNGLGRILFKTEYKRNTDSKQAQKKNLKLLKQAVLHFLRGVIQYTPESGGSTRETQRSLFWTAKTFAEMSLNAQKAEKKTKYQNEAQKIVNTLLRDYPNTGYRSRARKLKRKLQP